MKRQPPRAPWSKAMQEVLADGGWHQLSELMAAAAKAVPPGVAWRRAERHRVQSQMHKGGYVRPRRNGDVHLAIEVGTRLVAKDVLRALTVSGRVERVGDAFRCTTAKSEEGASS